MCVFRDLETGITWRENFLRIPIARRLWAAYEIKPNLENAMTFGIEFLVFLTFAELYSRGRKLQWQPDTFCDLTNAKKKLI
jgi:hypothetical protein